MTVSASTFGQKISLNAKNATLESVLQQIKQQSGYDFVCDQQLLENANPVTLALKNADIGEALKDVFQNQALTYALEDKVVTIKEKEPTLLDKLKNVFALPITIKGKVTDTTGEPLVAASITIKGRKQAVTTDVKGEFSFTWNENSVVLVVSYIGYEKREITITGSKTDLLVKLKRSQDKLDEVQVIAYGETTQRYSVGSQSKVTAEEIQEQPVTNPLQALEGRVPGLVVTQSSGLPGASLSVQIRGQNSLSPTIPNAAAHSNFDQPLFIIDGVPYSPQNANIQQSGSVISNNSVNTAQAPGAFGVGPFNSINPADIESIEVLRDADATSIYGSRGANGVILITTKRGKAGKTTVNGSVSTGDSKVTNLMPMMNTQQYLQMRHEALNNDGVTPSLSNGDYDLLVFDTTKNTNWSKYFLGGTAHTTDANTSLSGGNNNTQFFVSAGYHTETYIYPGDFGENRLSVNSNLHYSSTDKKFTLDFSTNYSYDQNNTAGNYNLNSAFTLAPDYPNLLNPNGTLNWNYKGVDISPNPLAYLKEPYSFMNYNLISHLQLNYEVFPGLSLRSSFGYNSFNSNQNTQDPSTAQDPALGRLGSATFNTNTFQTWIIEPQAEYKRTIAKDKLNILLGGTFQQNTNTLTSINGSNYPNDLLLGSITSAGATTVSGSSTLYKYNAIFGRINYIVDSKYILDVTGRRDGSSKFGPGRQFGNFGSVGAGWIFSEEKIVKDNLDFLSYGKLKASYGTAGNDGSIGGYQYLSAYKTPTNNYTYQGSSVYLPANLYNPDFSWATTKKLQIGTDFGFFKDRLLASIEWFQDRSSSQLVNYTLPTQTGFSSVLQNAPYTVQNRGLEIEINSKNIKSDHFSWNTSFNLTIPKNDLLSFPGIATSSYASTYIVGQPLSVIQGYKFVGVNPTTGLYQFLTANGTPTYNPVAGTASQGGDYKVLGNLDPKFYGGLSNTFNYKGLQLDVFLQFTKQMGPNYLLQVYGYSPRTEGVNLPVTFLSAWKKPGNITSIQQLTETFGTAYNSTNYFGTSGGAYSDASFIRFKTVALSYSLKGDYIKKIGMQSCRIYLNAQNLFTITDYKGNDPENQNFYALPPLKTIVAGLQFTF